MAGQHIAPVAEEAVADVGQDVQRHQGVDAMLADLGNPVELELDVPRQRRLRLVDISEAARENAGSRAKAGLLLRFATGLELGRQIGQHVIRTALPRQRDRTARAR